MPRSECLNGECLRARGRLQLRHCRSIIRIYAPLVPAPTIQRDAARLLDAKGQDEMERHIADDPESHPRIPGGSGMRKARWAGFGRGKRGGVRVIYYFAAARRRLLHRGVCEEREGESQ